MIRKARRHAPRLRPQGFSLPEVLISMFILAIGMISIAALFPAGIVQQRQSVDDIMGPVVANNALAVLRTKLRPEDFGYLTPSPTIEGDFGWSRPAYFTKDVTLSGNLVPAGSLSIFDGTIPKTTDTEVPWNPSVYPPSGFPDGPTIIITQNERYYPMVSGASAAGASSRPQYVWDCMFRRFQGKVLVAIFVYRTALPGGAAATYNVAPILPPNADDPPLPFDMDLTESGAYPWSGAPWDADADLFTSAIEPFAVIPDTEPTADPNFNPSDQAQAWQVPGQWILDQNNNVHRVLNGRRRASDGPVELLRAVGPVMGWGDTTTGSASATPYYYIGAPLTFPQPGFVVDNVVTNIWYIPSVSADGQFSLTPVFVSVKEL